VNGTASGTVHADASDDAATSPGATADGSDDGHREKDADLPDSQLLDGASGLLFGAACLLSIQCASGICLPVEGLSSFCTQKCTHNADCPAGSGGCAAIGFCRK
jgi:hypothetical protein